MYMSPLPCYETNWSIAVNKFYFLTIRTLVSEFSRKSLQTEAKFKQLQHSSCNFQICIFKRDELERRNKEHRLSATTLHCKDGALYSDNIWIISCMPRTLSNAKYSNSSEQLTSFVLWRSWSVGRQMLNKAITSSGNHGVRALWELFKDLNLALWVITTTIIQFIIPNECFSEWMGWPKY